jgi:predicted RNA-binding Zn-ribbon protein involved in translation (DUF1610 family)
MKEKICRECGNQFTLTDKQIDFYIQHGFEEPIRCQKCRREKRRMEYVPCKDCGIVFSMDGLEMKFYEKQGFMMPKRCPTCRKRRREVKC